MIDNSHETSAADNTDTNTPANDTTDPVVEQTDNQPDQQEPIAKTRRSRNIASRALNKIDQAIPDDKENITAQAIKHDVLETPAAILNARRDIKDMRSRGRRSLFENKEKSGKSPVKGKKRDCLWRRRLDRSYIATQAAVNLMPDEQQGEDSGTKGVRTMITEGAKIVKILATAEKRPTKMRHSEDEERLIHENISEQSRLEHKEEADTPVLQHENSTDTKSLDEKAPKNENETEIDAKKTENRDDIDDKSDSDPTNRDTEQNSSSFTNDDTTTNSDTDTKTESVSRDTENAETGSNPDNANHSEASGKSAETDASTASNEADIPQPKSKKDIKIENNIDHKIDRYTERAEKLEKKIEKAEAKIPKKKVKTSKLVHDEKSGKEKRQISFSDEKIAKSDAKWNQPQSKTISANTGRYITGHASAIAHGKFSETENLTGNTGVKAVHSGEKAIERTYSTAKRIHRYVKNTPYRRLEHLKVKESRNKGRLAYQKLLKDKPELRTKPLSRFLQKQRIKREYAKAFRAAQSGESKIGIFGKVGAVFGVGAAVVSGDGKTLAKLGLKVAFKKAVVALIKGTAPILLKLGLLLLIIMAILLLFTMCATLFSTTTGFVLESVSYAADADDITEYSVYMTKLEVDLKEAIIEAASDLEGLHEFRFVVNSPSGGGTDIIFEGTLITPGLGHPYFTPPVYAPPIFDPLMLLQFLTDITHNPFELMAYLTTVYGDFTGYDIPAILREIFETAFYLEIIESYEVRYAVVEAWYYELQYLGEWQYFGIFGWIWVSGWQEVRVPPYTEILYYNWYYREVVLTVNATISEIIQERMNDEQREHYDILMESLGLRQFVSSPFEDNWLGSVSSPFGYRFHPITGLREMHTGIDIAKPEGTPIMSGAPGTVVFAGEMGSYGNTVIIEYVDEASGRGVRILYAHMADISVVVGDVMEIGSVLGTVGQTGTATGAHLHIEVSITENGGEWRLLNPLFFIQPYVS